MSIESPTYEDSNSLAVKRIDRLWDIVREEKSQDKNTWLTARLTAVASEIRNELAAVLPGVSLRGIPEWEKLIGGSEEEDVDVTARNYVQELLDEKLTSIEEQWGIN